MSWEFDEGSGPAARDWSKVMWYTIGLAVVVMLIFLLFPRGEMDRPTRARVWHLRVDVNLADVTTHNAALAKIEDLRQQVIDGADFSELAKEHSDDRDSGPRGGDLGWVERGDMGEAMDEAIWVMPLNEVSEVFLTEKGLHLLLVTGREFSAAERYERDIQERVLRGTSEGTQP